MKECCYCESSRGHLIVIAHHYWHKECLISRSRYFDYLQGNLKIEIAEKKNGKSIRLNMSQVD